MRLPPLLRALLAPALALLLGAGARADTVLPDTLLPSTGHTFTLTAAESPYFCERLSYVLPGDSLVAEAGAVVHFGINGGLQVQGTIVTRGDANHPVRFARDPNAGANWEGIRISPLGYPSDTTRCEFLYTRISKARTAVTTTQRIVPQGEDYCVSFLHCAVDSSSLGIVCYLPGRYLIQNCVFNEIRAFCVYTSRAVIDIRNNVFLPSTTLPVYAHGILLWNVDWSPHDHIHYNCFYPGADEAWQNHIETFVDGDVAYTRVIPDSTHIFLDPLLDTNYYPDPASPVIDAGDPTLQDPDLTRSDMGMHWFLGNVVPCTILSEEPSPSAWVQGFPYLGQVDIEAYPPATWTLEQAPPGMQTVQINRNRLVLAWPVEQQVTGQFPILLRGFNEVNEVVYRDSLQAVLDLSPNHPPRLTLVQPCPSGDCLDQPSVLEDRLPAGAPAMVRIRYADEDSTRLGLAQHYEMNVRINGVPQPTIFADSLALDFVLDTARVEIQLSFTDGLLSDSLFYTLAPRYSLLEGDVEGVIGAETGAVYMTGPLRVPAGRQLRIEAGSRFMSGDSGDEWLLDVEGELTLEGTADEPIHVRSSAEHTDAVDRRPLFMRIKDGAQVAGLAHLDFEGFATAIQVEHVDNGPPLLIEDCRFARTRVGVLAIHSPVEVRGCRFEAPRDTLQLGSYGIYLADAQGCRVQNNLFINPIVGVQAVDADALLANNSFMLVPDSDPYYWPLSGQLGFGRVQILNSSVELRNNLFQWRMPFFGPIFTPENLEYYLEHAPRGVWLDAASEVRSEYNWFDDLNGWMAVTPDSLVNMMHIAAYNDSTLLVSDIRAGLDSSRVDRYHDFRLFADSPLIDAGDPDPQWNDSFDGSRCDVGWTGGPLALENEYTPVAGHDSHLPPPLVELPRRFRLAPPWPNPFNPATRLEVEVGRAGLLDLRVYDLWGRQVAVLAHGPLEPGRYRFALDAGAWASGCYFARARLGGEEQVQRLLLVK